MILNYESPTKNFGLFQMKGGGGRGNGYYQSELTKSGDTAFPWLARHFQGKNLLILMIYMK